MLCKKCVVRFGYQTKRYHDTFLKCMLYPHPFFDISLVTNIHLQNRYFFSIYLCLCPDSTFSWSIKENQQQFSNLIIYWKLIGKTHNIKIVHYYAWRCRCEFSWRSLHLLVFVLTTEIQNSAGSFWCSLCADGFNWACTMWNWTILFIVYWLKKKNLKGQLRYRLLFLV